jgi:hypothetical protein
MTDLVETYFRYAAVAEGGIPYLYLDTKGHLTIGYGHLVLNRKDLKQANWRQVLTKEIAKLWSYNIVSVEENRFDLWDHGRFSPACRQRIPGALSPSIDQPPNRSEDDLAPGPWGLGDPWGLQVGHNVHTMVLEAEEMLNMPYGKKFGASSFEPFTSFRIGEKADMIRLAYDDIRLKIKEVKQQANFTEFDSFPMSGQLAVLDLAYQGGATGIAQNYKNGEFGKAVKERRWYDAAKLCPGPNEGWPPADRQHQRKAWLLEALEADLKSDVGNRYMYKNEALGFSPEKIA